MFMDRVEEIHVTEVQTKKSGDVFFPKWDRSLWSQQLIETVGTDEENEYDSTYSIWTKG